MTSNKQPIFSAYGGQLHHAFGDVVIDGQCAVFGVATQGLPLIQGVREGLTNQTFGKDVVGRSSLLASHKKTFRTFKKNESIDLVALLAMRYIVGPPSLML